MASEELPLLTVEEIPLTQSSVEIMKFLSLLMCHDWRRFVGITIYLIVSSAQLWDIYLSDGPVESTVRKVYIFAIFLCVIFRAISLTWYRFEYEIQLNFLRELYVEILLSKDHFVLDLLKQTERYSHLFGQINLGIGCLSMIGILALPIFVNSKILPFAIQLPGIDVYASPYYFIFYTIEVLVMPLGVYMYVPFTNLFVSMTMFGILMCKVLQHKLMQLNNMSPNQRGMAIVECVRIHLKFIKFVTAINKLTTYVHLVEFLANGALLYIMLFMFVIVHAVGQQVIMGLLIVALFGQSVVIYLCANELYDQSLAVAVAAYNTNWYDFDLDTQKKIKFIMMRSQKPCGILVGGVHAMNLALLHSLLKVSYSYFTLLQRVYDK